MKKKSGETERSPLFFARYLCYNEVKLIDRRYEEDGSMQDHIINDQIADLARAMLELDNMDEDYRFFEDIFTIHELQAVAQRLAVARLLQKKVTYQEIAERTGASTATISRVNRCLTYGAGGYQLILGKTKFGDEISEGNP